MGAALADDPRRTLPPPNAAATGSADLERGASLGRYLILDRLGAGGMGVVYTAFDASLDRKVALKLLRPEVGGDDLAVRQDRLVREARAMAKLSNPNVATVHDVGTFEGRLFIAMELVDGQTVSGWLTARRRTWREVVSVYLQAGRGLAAAHRAGLVHRDVKPDNLLVGKDGRVRVTDFGLVTSGGRPTPEPDAASTGDAGETLTRTGAKLGSPAYMSPEQHDGQPVTPASDQFSFCVALFEALYGTRPYGGDTMPELASNIRAGKLADVPARGAAAKGGVTGVPAVIQRALRRGLSADPADRYPDMEALLTDLARDPARTRRRAAAWVGGIGAVAAGALGLGFGLTSAATPCESPERHLAGVWDTPVQERIQAAFEATGLPQAGPVWNAVSGELNRYTSAWVAQRRQACEKTHVHGEQSAQMLDLRMHCLDRRLAEVDALTRLLIAADDEVLNQAVRASQHLPALAACADERALRAKVPPPTDAATQAQIAQVERGLADAQALFVAGRYDRALAKATEVNEQAAQTGHRPTQAEALLMLGRVQHASGKPDAAERSLRAALAAAMAGRHDRAAAQAWIELVEEIGDDKGRYQEGQQLADLAAAALERIGGDPALGATLAINQGSVLEQEKRYDEAAAAFQRAVDLRTGLFGEQSLPVAAALAWLATNLRHRREYDRAEQVQRKVVAIREKILGPLHPKRAQAISDLAAILQQAGKNEASLKLQVQALAIWEKSLRPNHPSLANAYNRMAAAQLGLGKVDECIGYFEKALAVRKAAYGPHHVRTADVHYNLGILNSQLKRYDQAIAQFEQAAVGYKAAQGPNSPKLGTIHYAICGMLRMQGKLEEGLAACQRSRRIWERAKGDHPLQLARTLVAIGQAQLGLKRPDQAIAPLETALGLHDRAKSPELELQEARFELARALWDTGRDRKRAVGLARQAWTFFEKAEGVEQSQRAEMAAWLKSRTGH